MKLFKEPMSSLIELEIVTKELRRKGKVVEDEEANSASEQKEEDMKDKIKAAEEEIEKITDQVEDKWTDKVDPEGSRKLTKSIFRKMYESLIKDEEKQKDKGDTGPSL